MREKCKTCNGSGKKWIAAGGATQTGVALPALWTKCPDCSCTQTVDKSPEHIVDANKKVPPEGYATWLDAAIATADFSGLRVATTQVLQAAARAELAELRATVARQQDQINAARMVLDD